MKIKQQNARAINQKKGFSIAVGGVAIILLITFIWFWSAYPTLTYKGVPISILVDFLQDTIAREAYFKGHKKALHHRLKELGVEEKIKDFYRPQFQEEQELDRYIHQLLYNNTGYIGAAYLVNAQGELQLKPAINQNFLHWFELAKKLNLAIDYEIDNGVIFIITPEKQSVPYTVISNVYSISELEKLLMVLQNH
ncbi:hypothetical protein G7B40_000895 [Aetokthonos hydrillicola Thurmond2011]|jgi:hypothetical protein|uniref:Uncharacterized protein n=1 Tax=Aetokthonos hydrillicola Thurmond2011 TaxID=2712845 RepID=A0AAP5I3M2_9CYAN|nr:hypothetical protein [Aetokthonos hydrillicola]MBO3463415.1 hypothetical protein [Aetokthonos hydrillicola CCALA 1050]MBW4588174.1 hypothetical protein [Aetokthonos hydrillicola CCALA 1050]MDR9893142.1 hypothetical protein [Aetokthonos hydrillicola Thurmond2011]